MLFARRARKAVVASLFALALSASSAHAATYDATPGSLGAIPDSTDTQGCTTPGAARDVLFSAEHRGGRLLGVEVSLTGTHSWAGDLTAELIAPDGRSAWLLHRPRADTATSCGTSIDFAGPYVFTDDAEQTFADAAVTNPAPAGRYLPSGVLGAPSNLLATFAATTNRAGTWRVRLRDFAAADPGTITAASLRLVSEVSAVEVAVQGAGHVVSTDGLDCSAGAPADVCRDTLTDEDPRTDVTLYAAPAAGMVFAGYTGGPCGASPACTVTFGADKIHQITARFVPVPTAAPAPPPAAPVVLVQSGGGPSAVPAGVRLRGGPSVRVRGGAVLLRVVNAGSSRTTVAATLWRGTTQVLARGRVTLAPSANGTVRLVLSRAARRALRSAGRKGLKARIELDAAGGEQTFRRTTAALTLRAGR